MADKKMKWHKRLLGSTPVQATLCWIVAQYIRLVFHTTRWDEQGREIPDELWQSDRGFIFAFWHGRLLVLPPFWSRGTAKDGHGKTLNMLISGHRDGQLISRTVSHLGIQTVAGSRSKGAASALRKMVGVLKAGGYVGITPDGPRGPYMSVSEGTVRMAQMAGVPIIPICVSYKRRKVANSWDRFHIPSPFNRGTVRWGQPLYVPKDMTPQAAQEALRVQMTELAQQVDKASGHTTPPALEKYRDKHLQKAPEVPDHTPGQTSEQTSEEAA